MAPIVELLDIVITVYMWVVIGFVVLSWLVAFEVLNTRNHFVRTAGDALFRLTEPALKPLRRVMPNLGGIDISPVILIFIIIFFRYVIALYIIPNVP